MMNFVIDWNRTPTNHKTL